MFTASPGQAPTHKAANRLSFSDAGDWPSASNKKVNAMSNKYVPDYIQPVRLAPCKEGEAKIYPVRPDTAPESQFKPSQLPELWAVAKASGVPLLADSFWLAGVQADIRREYERKDGTTGERGYAYTPEQVAAFDAQSFKLKVERNRWGSERIYLMCFETPWEPKTTSRDFARPVTQPEKPKGDFGRKRS